MRQEVKDTKVEDDSFYLLTLATVAKELKRRGLEEAKVFLAVGLPLTRFGAEKNDFIKYLTKNKRVSFKYENEPYHIEIDDVAVFPQCYAAVVDKIPAMAKKTLIVDIGSWTIDIMPVINKSPDESKCVTIPKGLITCMRRLYEEVLEQLNKVKKQIPEESEYVKALISHMDEVVEKINHQNERYDALNKKLSEIETSKDDEEVRGRLVKENQDKDALINSQQNELNKARIQICTGCIILTFMRRLQNRRKKKQCCSDNR